MGGLLGYLVKFIQIFENGLYYVLGKKREEINVSIDWKFYYDEFF